MCVCTTIIIPYDVMNENCMNEHVRDRERETLSPTDA